MALSGGAPRVDAADVEIRVEVGARAVGARMTHARFDGDLCDADAAERRRGAGEVRVDDRLRDAERLEDLRAVIAGDGADAHLAHDLEQALFQGVDVVLGGGGEIEVRLLRELGDRLEREVRIHGAGAEPDE